MRSQRRSGWRRLGVVVTVVWVAGAFGFAVWLATEDSRSYPARIYALCMEIAPGNNNSSSAAPWENDPIVASNPPRVITFEGRRITVPHDATDDEIRSILNTAPASMTFEQQRDIAATAASPNSIAARCQTLFDDAQERFSKIPFNWLPVLLVTFAPIPLFWFCSWVLLAIGRWIRRGFEPHNA